MESRSIVHIWEQNENLIITLNVSPKIAGVDMNELIREVSLSKGCTVMLFQQSDHLGKCGIQRHVDRKKARNQQVIQDRMTPRLFITFYINHSEYPPPGPLKFGFWCTPPNHYASRVIPC